MSFLFRLAYMASISLTVVGFISATSDWGDFLNAGISQNAWGLVTVVSAVIAVVTHILMFGLARRETTSGLGMGANIGLYVVHCIIVLVGVIPAGLTALAVFSGGISVAYIASVLALAILAIPMTSFFWNTVRDMQA